MFCGYFACGDFSSSKINFVVLLFITTRYAGEIYAAPNDVTDEHLNKNNAGLRAPQEVFVKKVTANSIFLTWSLPEVPADNPMKLFSFILSISPLTAWGTGREVEHSLPPTITSKEISGLQEGTRYSIVLSAVYGDPSQRRSRNNLVVVPAPKFTVSVPSTFQHDVPVGDDGLPSGEPSCNCSEVGMVACTRRPGFVECTCETGYTGKWCEKCAAGNFLVGKECRLCPCTNSTSSAECTIDSSGKVSCTECLPGHRGSLCTSCSAGYHWIEDRCTPLDCLSSSLCAEQRDAPGCEECNFLDDRYPAPAQRSNADRGIADGTLPLIAVVVTLGVLLLVAAMATCYRYWAYHRHQPRVPFWSIELQDEKSDLHANCQYQHLDAATNRVVEPRLQHHGSMTRGVPREGGHLTNDSMARTYNTINI